MAFESNADLTGENMDNNKEIFTYNTTTVTFTQITDTTGSGNEDSTISADGTLIAFRSTANITGGNPLMLRQVYVADTTAVTITQITNITTDSTFSSSISADGTHVGFYSDANVTGGNPEGNFEVYLANVATGIITQITDFPTGTSANLSVNADGTRIAFESQSDINGGNPDGNREIYVYDTNTGTFTQVTDEVKDSEDPSINYDGTHIAFESNANINGGNPDEIEEVFVATCLDPATARNIPTLSEWGLIAMAGVLGMVGFIAIRRKKATA